MTYYTHSPRADPGAVISASISWESAAGNSLNKESMTVVKNENGEKVGGTLQADVLTTVSGTEVPSYNCSAEFNFTGSKEKNFVFANNSVSWTCSSQSAPVWRTYQPNPSLRPLNEWGH